MIGAGIWTGLRDSAFIADLDTRDRAIPPILGSLVVGVFAAIIAAIAVLLFVLAAYALVTGHGREGLEGVRRILLTVRQGGPPSLSSQTLQLLLGAGVNGVVALTFVAVAAAFAHRHLHGYVTTAPQIRWRLLALGLALGALVLAPVLLVDGLMSGSVKPPPVTTVATDPAGRLVYLATSLLFIPAAAAEELFFRGWCLRLIAAFARRPGFTVVGSAVVFSLLHFDFSPDGLIMRAVMGAGFAYMTLRLGGIEFSTGVHAMNNMLIIVFVEPLSLQPQSEGAGLSLAALLIDALLIVAYVTITEGVARWPALRRWAGVDPRDLSPALPPGQRRGGPSSPFD